MHGNQWVLKIAVLKYYSVSKRGTTAKSNPKQATDPISLHTKFGDNSSNTFPLNERKPCVTPDIGHRTPDGRKSKNSISTPQGGGHNNILKIWGFFLQFFFYIIFKEINYITVRNVDDRSKTIILFEHWSINTNLVHVTIACLSKV